MLRQTSTIAEYESRFEQLKVLAFTFAVVFDPGCAASFTIDPGGFASAGRKTQWLEFIFATLTPSPITIVGAAWLDNLIATARIIKEICCIIRM